MSLKIRIYGIISKPYVTITLVFVCYYVFKTYVIK